VAAVRDLERALASGSARVVVVGIGRVGLPLAISFADAGLDVVGVDRNADHVALVNAGQVPFVEAGAGEVLERVLAGGKFRASTDGLGAVAGADAVVVTVGTPLSADLRADRSQVEGALKEWGEVLPQGALVVMRSTLSPGTTAEVVTPTLERLTGRTVGDGLFVAFCPERIAEGKAIEELRSLPEIVGGVEPKSTELAARLFQMLGADKTIHRTDSLSAELAKLFGNVYRYVSFALANEYALISEHYARDAHSIIGMVRDGYPRAPLAMPGPAGGPCLSKDGYFLIEELTFPDFVLTAWKLNDSVPIHMVDRVGAALAARGASYRGARVAVLGRAFKADIDDDRMSPSLRIIEALKRRGAEVVVHDPYLAPLPLEDALAGSAVVFLATNHRAYRDLDAQKVAQMVAPGCVVGDCWGMFDVAEWEAAGLPVVTLGKG
jgi:UDP-N-acetyl-D-mannosaminuronic acid dehydrogenase